MKFKELAIGIPLSLVLMVSSCGPFGGDSDSLVDNIRNFTPPEQVPLMDPGPDDSDPTVDPSPSPDASPSASPAASPVASPSPSPSPSASPSPSPSSSPSPSPSPSPDLGNGAMELNFLQDNGSRTAQTPANRMAPALVVADVWSTVFQGRPAGSKINWNFGDTQAPIFSLDPDPTGLRTSLFGSMRNTSSEQQGFVGAYVYRQAGTYRISTNMVFESGNTGSFQEFDVTILPDTRVQRYVDANAGSDSATGTSNDPWRTLAHGASQAGDNTYINLRRGQTHSTTGVTLNQSNLIIRSEPGSGANAIVMHTANQGTLFNVTGVNIGFWQLDIRTNGHLYTQYTSSARTTAFNLRFATNTWILDSTANGRDNTGSTGYAFSHIVDLDHNSNGLGANGIAIINLRGGPDGIHTARQVYAGQNFQNFVLLGSQADSSYQEHQLRFFSNSNRGPTATGASIQWGDFEHPESNANNWKPIRLQRISFMTIFQSHILNIQFGYDGAPCTDVLVDSTYMQGDPVPVKTAGSWAPLNRFVTLRNNIFVQSQSVNGFDLMIGGTNDLSGQEAFEQGSVSESPEYLNNLFLFRGGAANYPNTLFNFVIQDRPQFRPIDFINIRFANNWIVLPSDWESVGTGNERMILLPEAGDVAFWQSNVFPNVDRYDNFSFIGGALHGFSQFNSAVGGSFNIQENQDPLSIEANGYGTPATSQARNNGSVMPGVHHDYRGIPRDRNAPTWPVGAIGSEAP